MLVSKIKTYPSGKMHLKKLLQINPPFSVYLSPNQACLFVITFLGYFVTKVSLYCIFVTSIKFLFFYTNHDLFPKKIFWDLDYRTTNFWGCFNKGYGGEKKILNACSGLSTHRHNYCKMIVC
jgi:hypothetical protein